ncbi:MAG: hypothetical protein KUG77_13365 [Nannocystaceae bacterium]|nr:hypothetical protein [Nannocystaceae bacterium]
MRLPASAVATCLMIFTACGTAGDNGSPFGSAGGATWGAGESGSADGSTTADTTSTPPQGSSDTTGGSGDTTFGSQASTGPSDTSGGDSSEGGTGETTSTTGGDSDTEATGGESTGDTPLSDDPFDPASCNGIAWSGAEALAELDGLPRTEMASATIQVRMRSCTGDDCGLWGLGEDWIIPYLTWSGGVVTAYADLEAAMNLVLFDDGGVARLSMQHETFGVGGYPDDDGVLYGFPPQVVNYPHLRAYNQFPESENYYIDLDYQVAQGELVLGEGCAVWTANPYGTGQPYTAQYGVVFHW